MAGVVTAGRAKNVGSDLWYVDLVWEAGFDGSTGLLITHRAYAGYVYAISTIPGPVPPRNNSDLDLLFVVDGVATSESIIGTSGKDAISSSVPRYIRITSIPFQGYIGFRVRNNNVPRANGTVRLHFRMPKG